MQTIKLPLNIKFPSSIFLDTAWASINHGVVICNECASVHRTLGRHVSQIKSLKSPWYSAQLNVCVHRLYFSSVHAMCFYKLTNVFSNTLQMVYQLSNGGSNNIWEFGLRSASANSKPIFRKPTPTDSLQYVFY